MSGPLLDPQGKFVRYEIRLNLGEWTYINSAQLYNSQRQDQAAPITFPSTGTNALSQQAIEVKSAWKELTPAEIASNRFYTSQAFLYDPSTAPPTCSGPTTMGLVGLHLAHKTQNQPNWIWSTFEHVANAPTQGQPIPPGATYNFYDPQCTVNGVACDTNCVPQQWQSLSLTSLPPVPRGANDLPGGAARPGGVIPDGTGQMPDGSPAPNTQAQNTQWQAQLAGTVWANYQLVSTQWTEYNGTVLPAQLTNTTMETYFQDNSFGSCIMCHGTAATASQNNLADKSFLLESAFPHSSLLRETPDRSVVLDFAGQAAQVGSGAANATVWMTGSALLDDDLNLGTAKLAMRKAAPRGKRRGRIARRHRRHDAPARESLP